MGIIQTIRRRGERRRVDQELAVLAEHAPRCAALESMPPARRHSRGAAERVAALALVSVVVLGSILGSSLYLGSLVEEREAEAQASAALDSARQTYAYTLRADYEVRGAEMPEPGRVISGQADYEPTTEAAAAAREDVIAAEARLKVLEEDPSPVTALGQRVTGAYR